MYIDVYIVLKYVSYGFRLFKNRLIKVCLQHF